MQYSNYITHSLCHYVVPCFCYSKLFSIGPFLQFFQMIFRFAVHCVAAILSQWQLNFFSVSLFSILALNQSLRISLPDYCTKTTHVH